MFAGTSSLKEHDSIVRTNVNSICRAVHYGHCIALSKPASTLTFEMRCYGVVDTLLSECLKMDPQLTLEKAKRRP